MVELISLSCNHCGAPIDVPKVSKFVTCEHCNSRLKIQSSGSATYTEVLEVIEEIKERNDEIAEDLEIIKTQNEIERLDRDWDRWREKQLSRDEDGNTHEPSTIGSIVGAAVIGVGGIMFAGFSDGGGALISLGAIAFAIIFAIYGINHASTFNKSKRRYKRERKQLVRRLRKAKR